MKLKNILAPTVLALTIAADVPSALASPQEVRFEPAVATSHPQFVNVARRRRRRSAQFVVRRRSKKKSAAIVGGSAAGGAAIGALAGGGKGAAIGALAGGGAGLVYDRSTHKKVIRER